MDEDLTDADRTAESIADLARKRLEADKKERYSGIKVINGKQSPSLMELARMQDEINTKL